MNKLTETDKAYLAGVLDGDGCIYISRSGASAYFAMRVIFSQCNETLLSELQQRTNLGAVHIGRVPSSDNHRTLYQWQITGQQAEALLQMLMPYLILKKAQAEVALRFRKTYGKHGKGGQDGIVPDDIIAKREECRLELQELKQAKAIPIVSKEPRPKTEQLSFYQ